MVTSGETPVVTVKMRPHVKQLVKHRFEFFAKGQIEETGQAESENVEEFAVAIDERINPPPAPLFFAHSLSILKSERCQLCPQSRASAMTCPRDAHGHPFHLDVCQSGNVT